MSSLISNIQGIAIEELQKMDSEHGYKGSDMRTACYVAESLGSFSKAVEHLITRKTYQNKLRTALPDVELEVNVTWDGLITVHYVLCEVENFDSKTYYGNIYGSGITFEDACEDYYNRIKDKRIRLNGEKEIFFSA